MPESPDINEEFLTVEQLAEKLQVSTRTIQRLVERNELRSFRVGRQIRFRREWITEWIERASEPSVGENPA